MFDKILHPFVCLFIEFGRVFNFLFYCMSMDVLPECTSVYHFYVWWLKRPEEGVWSLWDWSHRQLWVSTWGHWTWVFCKGSQCSRVIKRSPQIPCPLSVVNTFVLWTPVTHLLKWWIIRSQGNGGVVPRYMQVVGSRTSSTVFPPRIKSDSQILSMMRHSWGLVRWGPPDQISSIVRSHRGAFSLPSSHTNTELGLAEQVKRWS